MRKRKEAMGTAPAVPFSEDAEAGLLACVIMEGGQGDLALEMIEKGITEEAFHKESHRYLFRAVMALMEEGVVLEPIALTERLKSQGTLSLTGGMAEIDRLMSRIEVTPNGKHWLEVVQRRWWMREAYRAGLWAVETACQPVEEEREYLDDFEKKVFAIRQSSLSGGSRAIASLMDPMVSQIEGWAANPDSAYGLLTGFTRFDLLTFGLHPGQMIVVAARPGVGKTAFAGSLALNVAVPKPARKGEVASVLMFTLEMGAEEMAMRLLCGRANLNSSRLREGFLEPQQRMALKEAASYLRKADIRVDDSSGISITELRAKARREHALRPLNLIVIDYLQLLAGTNNRKNSNREQEIAEISRGCKALAKELRVPVMVLSQLNRESEKQQRDPRISDLRESGSIEQDADVVLILAKLHEKDPFWKQIEGQAVNGQFAVEPRKLIVAKQRNGPIDDIILGFDGSRIRYVNYSWNSGK